MEITLGNWIIYEILFYPGILKESRRENLCFFPVLIVFFPFLRAERRDREIASRLNFYFIRFEMRVYFLSFVMKKGRGGIVHF